MLLLCLLHCLFPQRVRAIYINHQLQPDNDRWAVFVQKFCEQHHIPYLIKKIQVAKGNLEEQARNARFYAFQQVIFSNEVLVLAHHQQDQAETFLLRLFSGAGVNGLKAMQKIALKKNVKVWRPLLDVPREKIEQWIKQDDIPYVTDQTNFNQHYDRAWARHTLWNTIKTRFPKMQTAITRTALLMQDADEILQEVLQQDLKCCVDGDVLDIQALNSLTPARRRQLLSWWLKTEYRPSLDTVKRLQKEVIHAKEDAQAQFFVKPFWYVRYQGKIYRLTEQQKNLEPCEIEVFDSQNILLNQTYGLSTNILKDRLMLYPRLGGERVHLYGRVGAWPLKKAIQEAKILPWQRHQIQILKKENVILGIITPQGFWLAQSDYCVPNGWLPKLDGGSL